MTAAAAQNMTVVVRVRPLSSSEQSSGRKSCCDVVGQQVVTIEKFGQKGRHLQSQRGSLNEYAFDLAFGPESKQSDIYEKSVKPIVPTILDGFNATVFAYGATGAGKTHTMMGSERDDESRSVSGGNVDGIIPQALSDIFDLVTQKQQEAAMIREKDGTIVTWEVLISYLEVYNEQIRDLLEPSKRNCTLREDPAQGIVHVAGLHSASASSSDEVMELLRKGNRNRTTEPTAANKVSSRSHAVLQVEVKHKTKKIVNCQKPQESTTVGKLSLIDLAGSERASATQNRGLRLTEGANINRSLLALANCINALASNTQRRMVTRRQSDVFSMSTSTSKAKRKGVTGTTRGCPKVQYRDSKLTHLLKSSLEGNCRLVMIANINPSDSCFEESHNTLKYANRAKNIKVRPQMHAVTADITHQQRADVLEEENIKLREQIASLRLNKENKTPRRRQTRSSGLFSEDTQLSKRTQQLQLSDKNTMEDEGYAKENEQLREKNRSLEVECRAMERKIKSLEIQLEKLRTLEKPAAPLGTVLRRSARRQSMATLPSVDENEQSAASVAVKRRSSRETSRRKSLIPLPPVRTAIKRKQREDDNNDGPVKTPKRSATSTPKSDRKLRSTRSRMSLNEITNN